MRRIGIVVVLAGMLVACKGKDEDSKAATPAPSSNPADPAGPAADKPTPAAASPIDVCSFATKEQVESALGPLTADPTPQASQGSLLGGCEYAFEGGLAFASARPAHEFDRTLEAYQPATEIPGVSGKAFDSEKAGVFLQPAGASYFLHIFVGSANGGSAEKRLALTKVIAAGANSQGPA